MIDVKPLSASLGGRVSGLQLTDSLDAAQIDAIVALTDEHGVLQFDAQSLTAEQLRDFTARFGPLFLHHADEGVLFADGVREVGDAQRAGWQSALWGI